MPINYGETNPVAPAGIATREKLVSMMKGRFFEFKESLDGVLSAAGSIVVTNDVALASAVELQSQVKRLMSDIENRRKDVTAPLVEDKRQVDGFANGLKVKCGDIILLLKAVVDPYLMGKERERKKKEDDQAAFLEAQRKKSIVDAAAEAQAAQDAAAETQAARDAAAEIVARANPFVTKGKPHGGGRVGPGPIGKMAPVTHQPALIPEIVPDQTKIQTASGSVTVGTDTVPEIVNLAAAVSDPGFIRARSKWLEPQVLTYARQCLKMGKKNLAGVVFKDIQSAKSRIR